MRIENPRFLAEVQADSDRSRVQRGLVPKNDCSRGRSHPLPAKKRNPCADGVLTGQRIFVDFAVPHDNAKISVGFFEGPDVSQGIAINQQKINGPGSWAERLCKHLDGGSSPNALMYKFS